MKAIVLFLLMFTVIYTPLEAADAKIEAAAGEYRVIAPVAPTLRDLNDGRLVKEASTNAQLLTKLIAEGRLGFVKTGAVVKGGLKVGQMIQVKTDNGPMWMLATHLQKIR